MHNPPDSDDLHGDDWATVRAELEGKLARIVLPHLIAAKGRERIAMMTAYDAAFARLAGLLREFNDAGVLAPTGVVYRFHED